MDPHPKDPNYFLSRLYARIGASRFLTFSLLVHVIIVVIAGSIVFFESKPTSPQFVALGHKFVVETNSLPHPPEDPHVDVGAVETPEVQTSSVSAIASTAPVPFAIQLPTSPSAISVPASPASFTIASHSDSPAIQIPNSMRSRAGGERPKALETKGGTKASEAAVVAGLNWLKTHQNDDGSWSDEFKPAMSGLALLCFLGHGELQESADYGATVRTAVEWLMARGAEFDGRFSLSKDNWGDNAGVYQHAICTYALAEYYSMTHDERVKDLVVRTVNYIVTGQNADGSWSYMYDHGKPADTSVTGWQVQALIAAHLTGLQISGVDDALDRCMIYLREAQRPDGGFVYQGNDERYAMAGIGTLCTLFWKSDQDRTVREGVKYIVEQTRKDYPIVYKSPKADLYAWYYDTQACLMFGGEAWNRWNRSFQDEIVRNQSKDGAWPATPAAAGVGGLQGKADGAGPFYRTTLCTLMLEVFYRYTPGRLG